MIARPKMSQNEWKTTEIRAWQSRTFLTLFLPRYNYADAANAAHFARAVRRCRHSGATGLLLRGDAASSEAEKRRAEAAQRADEAAFLDGLDALAADFETDPKAALRAR